MSVFQNYDNDTVAGIACLDSATLVGKHGNSLVIATCERQGASRRCFWVKPAASALPLTKVALSNYSSHAVAKIEIGVKLWQAIRSPVLTAFQNT